MELDAESLGVILGNLVPRMGDKWGFIGIQLGQEHLVKDLRSLSSATSSDLLQRIIDAWFESDPEKVCPETVTEVLRSKAVKLGAVAKDFEEVR